MSIETCIAHAIHKDLDILEAVPDVQKVPVEELECYIEQYITAVQEILCTIVETKGEVYLRSKDAAGLCAACLDAGISLPPRMLLRMCQTIVQLTTLDAQFILDTEDGTSLYYVRMAVS
jgi:hypothetical protein